jgi:hypothetical protein
MPNPTVTPTSETPAGKADGYDPIKMLRVYLAATSDAPPHFGNFLINRLGDQITWYDNKSGFFKKQWANSRRWVIILSAAIPFLVGLIGMNFGNGQNNMYFDLAIKLFVGAAGVAIAILEGLNSLHKSQEHYIDYRMTAEQLRQEFSYFMGKSGDYADLSSESAYSKLVTRTEGIMAGENNRWAEVTRQNDKATMANDIQDAVQEYLNKHGVQISVKPVVENKPQPEPQIAPQPEPEPQPESQPEPEPQIEPLPEPELLPEPEIDPEDRNPEGTN